MDPSVPVRSADLDRLILRVNDLDLSEADRAVWTALARWARALAVAQDTADAAGLRPTAPASGTLDDIAERFRAAVSPGPSASVRGSQQPR